MSLAQAKFSPLGSAATSGFAQACLISAWTVATLAGQAAPEPRVAIRAAATPASSATAPAAISRQCASSRRRRGRRAAWPPAVNQRLRPPAGRTGPATGGAALEGTSVAPAALGSGVGHGYIRVVTAFRVHDRKQPSLKLGGQVFQNG